MLRKPRVLAVCVGGTVRSVALKDFLNGRCSCNALAASAVWQDEETLAMLSDWADLICPVQPKGELGSDASGWVKTGCDGAIIWHPRYDAKRLVVNIGLDKWGDPRHKDLVAHITGIVGPLVERLGVRVKG